MASLRISAISFLNTAPLMWDFEHGDAARDFAIEYTIPSACAAALAANQADIGIIPAFTYAEIPGLVILPNIAIAAKDFVRSILLVSKKPIEQVETVATDTSSRTSVALLQVLFTKFFGGRRQLTPHAPYLEAMLLHHDAALLIGDAALETPAGKEYFVYDLAHLWHERTGQPFVFAFWAVRLDSLDRTPRHLDLVKVFQQSRDHGLEPENLRIIAQEWSPKLRLSETDIHTYLTQNIHYYLDRENHAGLQLFLRYSQEIGLIPTARELRFLGPVAFGSARK
ncbi:MAG TPA: menaquinone biosynthesis protein [Candidatus Limnocylindrales bacterium]|nr:menaquinone biosynthesis protein [Candidatus Limnocylindrales bacterium]